jgi:hypothetical protein
MSTAVLTKEQIEFFKQADPSKPLLGLHRFIALEGDVEWEQDQYTGMWRRANPVVWDKTFKNTIANTGKTAYLQRLAAVGGPPAAFTTLAVGTDSTASAATQVQLNPSAAGTTYFQAADGGFPTVAAGPPPVLTNQITVATGSANFAWNEAGSFNGTVNGTSVMFNRVVIGPFTKSASVSIVYIASITQN